MAFYFFSTNSIVDLSGTSPSAGSSSTCLRDATAGPGLRFSRSSSRSPGHIFAVPGPRLRFLALNLRGMGSGHGVMPSFSRFGQVPASVRCQAFVPPGQVLNLRFLVSPQWPQPSSRFSLPSGALRFVARVFTYFPFRGVASPLCSTHRRFLGRLEPPRDPRRCYGTTTTTRVSRRSLSRHLPRQ
jgi:hypothetical protein